MRWQHSTQLPASPAERLLAHSEWMMWRWEQLQWRSAHWHMSAAVQQLPARWDPLRRPFCLALVEKQLGETRRGMEVGPPV